MLLDIRQLEPMALPLTLPPFLYITTTDLERERSVRDRLLLVAEGTNTWGISDGRSEVGAPPIFCGEYEYPFRLLFELGDVDGNPIDDILLPPIEFERSDPVRTALVLWEGFTVEAFLNQTINNQPLFPDTGTW